MTSKALVRERVYLVTKPQVDWESLAHFLMDENLPNVPESIRGADGVDQGAAVAEVAARLCYMSYAKGRRDIEAFINNLLSSGDGSVFEHINYGFVMTGVSRSLTHELVRHRAGFAYSQRSQRYVDEKGSKYIIPPFLEGDRAAEKHLDNFWNIVQNAYGSLVEHLEDRLSEASDGNPTTKSTALRKEIRQAARPVLPNATETKLFVTANVRAWRHFLEQRTSLLADREIRRLALHVLKILKLEAPLLFGDFSIEKDEFAGEYAVSEYRKV